jgi:hypothetical protein
MSNKVKSMSTDKIIDDSNPKLIKARRALSDATVLELEARRNFEDVLIDVIYQQGFDDGIEWMKDQFRRLDNRDEPESMPTKPLEPTEVEKITQDNIIDCITKTPGLRSSDITERIITLPVKPALSEKTIRLTINRLKNSGKIETKAGRWYSTKEKSALPDYQVMRYLPDGSKYLGADIIK